MTKAQRVVLIFLAIILLLVFAGAFSTLKSYGGGAVLLGILIPGWLVYKAFGKVQEN